MKEGQSRTSRYHAFCDDYYVNMNLNTEMDLPSSRETVLHFFEQVKKNYPVLIPNRWWVIWLHGIIS